ncbi:MAG: PhzF family phenazine biosynthesis protein [Marinilabiliales bacterium]|nr:MAG: PhzF family phenazine biosynthesis protein [Marinilabiliales bacterium]
MIVLYQVDAFAEKLFTGNPAAVCPLEKWLPDELLQNIAMENNLSETAFYVRSGDRHHIRWFTPSVEVELCGHATLATAWVLFNLEGHKEEEITFFSALSGILKVKREGDRLAMDFPVDTVQEVPGGEDVAGCFSPRPSGVYRGRSDYLLLFDNEDDIAALSPSMAELLMIDARGIIVTARGREVDFVSRFFAPRVGVDEDPVTGSAHTTLAPFWAGRLGKTEMTARQLSKRGGELVCRYLGDRVEINGTARLYMTGELRGLE